MARFCLAIADALEPRRLFAGVSLAPVQLIPTGSFPAAIATGDFNGDGHPDVVTADYGSGDVSVLLNHGDGTFAAAVDYPVGNGPLSVVVADVNGDGIPDLVVANSGVNALDPANGDVDSVSILLGRGDGTFAPKASYPVGTGPESVVVADFNGDGHPDIATANLFADSVSVLLNAGDGTFTARTDYAAGVNPMSLAAGDFNRDSVPDLVVADSGSDSVSLLLNVGDGTFKPRVDFVVGTFPREVLAADINGDGVSEIITSNLEDATLSILRSGPRGGLTTAANLPIGVNPLDVQAADVNADGRVDLLAVNATGILSIRTRQATGYLADRFFIPTGAGPQALAVADFNGDGKPDVVTADFTDNTVGLLLNNSPSPTQTRTTTTLGVAPNPSTAGSPVTLTATVRGAGGTPTGIVQFFAGSLLIGTAALADGVATAEVVLPAGVSSVTARYVGGDSEFNAFADSLSGPVTATAAVGGTGANLVAELVSTDLPSTFVPGQIARAVYRITNAGTTTARGMLINGVSLVAADGTVYPAALANGLAKSVIVIAPGRSILRTGDFFVPSNIVPGAYTLTMTLNTSGTVPETTTADNTAADAAARNAAYAFGTVGGRSFVTLTLPDVSGSAVTFRVSGVGLGFVTPTTAGFDVSLAATTTASVVSITTTGTGRVTLDNVFEPAPLAAFNAPQAAVAGTMAFADDVSRLTLAGLSGVAAAADFGSVVINGNLTGDVLAGVNAGADGVFGTADDTVAAGALRSIRVAGSDNAGIIGAGYDPATNTVVPDGSVDSITVSGPASADAAFVAETLPAIARLDGRTVRTATDPRFRRA